MGLHTPPAKLYVRERQNCNLFFGHEFKTTPSPLNPYPEGRAIMSLQGNETTQAIS